MASVKRKHVLIAVAAAAVILGGGGYWAATVFLKPSPATDYLNKIEIDGYQQISATGGHGSGSAASTGIYLGPTVSSSVLLQRITGPNLELKTTDLAAYGITPQPGSQFNQVALEYSAPSACGVEVGVLRPDTAPDPSWDLTGQQLQQVQSGTSMILDLQVSCGVTIGVGVGVS